MSTWYLSNDNITAGVLDTLTATAPSTADATSGWRVDSKASANYAVWYPNTKRAATAFSATEPSAFSKYGYRTPGTLHGTFATGTWQLACKVRSGATYYAQTGEVKIRLWRSTAADGTGATEITAGWQASGAISFTAAAQDKAITITTASIATFAMAGEYLFLEVEWSCGTSGGNAAADVFWKHGEGAAEALTTAAYTPTSAVATQIAVEVAERNAGAARATQLAVEVAENNAGAARITQAAVEYLRPSALSAIVTQVAVEVAESNANAARVTQVAVEVLEPSTPPAGGEVAMTTAGVVVTLTPAATNMAAGPTFDVGLRDVAADSSLTVHYLAAGSTTAWYTNVTTTSSAGLVPQVSGYDFDGDSAYCKANDLWYNDGDRHENVGKHVEESGGVYEPLHDQFGPVLVYPLDSTLDAEAYPWFSAIIMTRDDVTLDKPPGYNTRPSSWAGAGTNITVSGTEGDTWTVTGAGAAVARTLATRFWLRMERMAAKLEAEENLDPDWPIQLTANEHTANDDPAWASAIPVEDVTNWDNGRIVQLKFNTWPAAAEDETVTLTVNYSTVIIEDPCYTCHEHRFGALGTWQYERTTAMEVFSGVLTASGTVLFDLGLMPRDKARCLQHVDSISIALPAVAGEYVLDSSHGLDLIADPSTHGYGNYPRLMLNPAIDPWNWHEDYSGFAYTYEGVMGGNLVYGYEERERVMRGLKQTQKRQHCPNNQIQDDINYAKVLSRLADELNWQEGITATYDSASVATATTDADNVTLTALYWWDLRRGSGEYEPGNSDEITAGPRVKTWDDLEHIPFVPVTILSEYCTQGVAHGMAYASGEVSRGGGGSSDTTTAYDYQLVYLDGATWVPCGSFEPDPAGRWVTPPAPEKGRTYGVQAPGQSVVSIGEFANRELAIQTLASVLRFCRNPFIRRAFTGGVYLVAQSGLAATGDILGYYHGAQEACQWQQFAAKPLTGDYRNPTVSEGDDGSLLVSATNTATGAMDFALSRDGGRTWEAV